MRVGGLRTQQGAVVEKWKLRGQLPTPLVCKGRITMTPGQGNVITEYVIYGDGGGSFQLYLLVVYLLYEMHSCGG